MTISPSAIYGAVKTGGALGLLTLAGGVDNILSASRNNNSAYDSNSPIIFPADLVNVAAGRFFYMTFYFYQYQRPTIFSSVFPSPIGQIVLPIPAPLTDSQDVAFIEDDFSGNHAIGAAIDSGLQAARNSGGVTSVSGVWNAAVAAAGAGASATATAGVKDLVDVTGYGLGVSNAGALALQLGGLAMNPFLTVLFKAPSFKRHVFTWRFNPTNQQESDTIKFIFNKFRYHQLPDTQTVTAGVLLQYPDMCVPVISPSGYMYSFKKCVIENSVLNRAPGATPGFFSNSNAPTSLELTLSLLEIEYWLKKDIDQSDPNYVIGTIPQDLSGAI